ncbi:MAG: choice-of-anchor V domain-containing protein [bacterium]
MSRVILVLLSAIALCLASSAGPPDAKTGAPGEGTCNDCHSGPAGAPDSTSLTGVPGNTYTPGTLYNMTLSLQWAVQRRWGFELTALNSGGGSPGQVIVSDPVNTQFSSVGSGYLKQTSTGTFNGTPNGVSWTFQWQAPAAGSGTVVFYWCGNACNGNNSTSGDAVCRDSLVVNEGTGVAEPRSPVPARRWWRSTRGSRTVIEYRGDANRPVRVFAQSGRVVRALKPEADGEVLRVVWDGRDSRGRLVPAASYFIRLDDAVQSVLKVDVVR